MYFYDSGPRMYVIYKPFTTDDYNRIGPYTELTLRLKSIEVQVKIEMLYNYHSKKTSNKSVNNRKSEKTLLHLLLEIIYFEKTRS